MDGTADLHQECIEPGFWIIEGLQVRRPSRGHWLVVWEPGVRSGKFYSLAAARGAIVDAINAAPRGEQI
jgi:hypothetical protein